MLPDNQAILPLASQTAGSVTTFISAAAPGDEKLRHELMLNLSPFWRSGLMKIWHDGMLRVGKPTEHEVLSHLQEARIILLLLSPGFIASAFCYNQMQLALEQLRTRRTTVIPLLLRPIQFWKDLPIGKLTPLPANERAVTLWRTRELAWYEIVGKLHSIALGLIGQSSEKTPGYSFVLTDPPSTSSAFLHRSQLVEEVYHLATHSSVTGLVLTGASGTGKSTLASQLYTYADQQQQAGKGPLKGKPCWLTLEKDTTPLDVAGSLFQVARLPFPQPMNPGSTHLADALSYLMCSPDQPRLLIIDQFENWLHLHTGKPCHAEIETWFARLNQSHYSWRVLLVSRIYPSHESHASTSRMQEFRLPFFQPDESIQVLQMGSTQATWQELLTVAQYCQGSPLALELLRTLLGEHPGLHISPLFDTLQEQSLQTKDISKNIFYSIFTHYLSKEQQIVMQAFAIYREAISLPAAIAVAETWFVFPVSQARLTLRSLIKYHFLQISGNLCYRLPPVIADFVRLFVLENDPNGQREAHLRAAQYYRAQAQLTSENSQAYRSLAQYHALIETIWHFCQAGALQEAYDLQCQTLLFADLHRWGQNSLLLELYTLLTSSHQWPTELRQKARIANEMGEIQNALGRKHEARLYYERAVEAYRAANQVEGLVEALNNAGMTCRLLGEPWRAFQYYQEALRCCNAATDKIVWKGITLHNLGKALYEQGQQEHKNRRIKQARSFYMQALTHYRQALAWHREMGLANEEARTLHNMGEVYTELEQQKQAHKYYWDALKRFQAAGDRRGEGMTLNNLGILYENQGARDASMNALKSREKAHEYYQQALSLFRETGDHWQEGKTLRNLGRFFLTSRHIDIYDRCKQCLIYFLQASSIFQQLQAPDQAKIPDWIQEAILEELGKEQFAALWEEIKIEHSHL
jgi:tetratricopeptide (TPR) repeat protein